MYKLVHMTQVADTSIGDREHTHIAATGKSPQCEPKATRYAVIHSSLLMEPEAPLFSRFPKTRPPLPQAYQNIYNAHYLRNREGASPATSLAKKMESWMHRKGAADVTGRPADYRTLEIGAGSLNHLQYEPSSKHYEIVEPFTELYRGSKYLSRIESIYADLSEIQDGSYDRIISIAVFEHLCNLPSVVARCGTLLALNGQLRVAIPSEGTLLWGLGWRLTTGIEFKLRHGLDYGVLMKHEHVNTASEIAGVLRWFFKSIRQSVFGIAPALSFYQFFECTNPDAERCIASLR